MHAFCQVLNESIPDILKDESVAAAVAERFDEILSTEHTTNDPRDLLDRVLEVVLRHPIISSRFRQFIISEGTRGSQRLQVDLPPIQELFDTLRLVKNVIVLKNQTTVDDVAAKIYSQPSTGMKSEDVPRPAQPKKRTK